MSRRPEPRAYAGDSKASGRLPAHAGSIPAPAHPGGGRGSPGAVAPELRPISVLYDALSMAERIRCSLTPRSGANNIAVYACETIWCGSTLCSVPGRDAWNIAGSSPSVRRAPARRAEPAPPRVATPRPRNRRWRFGFRPARRYRRAWARRCDGDQTALLLGKGQGY